MSINYNALAISKGKTVKQRRARAKREDAKQLTQFRNRVWLREQNKYLADYFHDFGPAAPNHAYIALCQHCRCVVSRNPYAFTGEVHHRIFRGNKSTRYDPDNGVLLCNHLVNNCHEKAERKLITV